MTRINKLKDGVIGPTPNIQSRNERISTAAHLRDSLVAIVDPEPVGEVMLIAPSMKMTRAELAGIAIEKGIKVKSQSKAQLIAELEK
jgi:hypothetical protein